ncbi:Acetyltransferase (GNAT) domain-containing protein [Flavobacterium hercynium]|nr:Acetyltransferase (GNAT) domain-containing protein [Flavobacterium hercynium]
MWSEVLMVSKQYIVTKSVYKLVVENEIVGYYSFFHESENTIELDNLFVWPDCIGKGFGQILMNDFLFRLKNTDVKKVVLDAEPKAEKFYEKFGFVKIGEIETSIKDRFLPKMELLLDEK